MIFSNRANTCFLGPTLVCNPNSVSIVSVVFAQLTAECHYTLQWALPFPLIITPSHGGSGPPSNSWFLGPTQVLNLNGISITAAFFAGLTSVTDRLTDPATQSVTIGHIHVCCMGDVA